jgi:hypothetical protein
MLDDSWYGREEQSSGLMNVKRKREEELLGQGEREEEKSHDPND